MDDVYFSIGFELFDEKVATSSISFSNCFACRDLIDFKTSLASVYRF